MNLNPEISPDFDRAFRGFIEAAQARVNADYENFLGDWAKGDRTPPQLEIEVGKRYIRVVSVASGQRGAWAFVDTLNGDVLKADGWKRPAKGVRGSIYDAYCGASRARWTSLR